MHSPSYSFFLRLLAFIEMNCCYTDFKTKLELADEAEKELAVVALVKLQSKMHLRFSVSSDHITISTI